MAKNIDDSGPGYFGETPEEYGEYPWEPRDGSQLYKLGWDPHNRLRYEDKQSETEPLFDNIYELIKIVPQIVEVNNEVKQYFANHPEKLFTEISSDKFEELIADILKDFGFQVELTKATRDGGKDIYAYLKNVVGSFLMYVECKRWAPTHHVGIEIVQRMYGVQQAHKANKSMIVTTSYFTAPAIEESKLYENLMALSDYDTLVSWLNKYK